MALTRPLKGHQCFSKSFTISDPSTNDVICWSDAGDSFFIHDHERLAKEHLGNWFKHNKFASFVRQLNMYGFHKIPHLQQGVLRSDSDAEHSQFAHPDFHRGQEDRLVFIERKKQPGGNRDGNPIDLSLGVSSSGPSQSSAPSQQLDWHSIVTGITAIRRHQTNISNELSELKRSNQVLWQEAMETRERHQRQQDTINRIIKFLAGVFGQQVSVSPREKEDGRSSPHPVVPGTRLMIEGRKHGSGGKVEITEVQDEENTNSAHSRDPSPLPCMDETPVTTLSRPLSRANSDVSTPLLRDIPSFPTSTLPEMQKSSFESPASPISSTAFHSTSTNNNSIISTQPRYPASDITHESVNRPSSHSPSFDVKFQSALNQLSVSDLQQLFASLAAQTSPLNESASDGPQQTQGQLQSLTSQLAPYKAPFDFGPLSPPGAKASTSESDGLISNAPYRIDQNWEVTDDIEKDVTSVNSGIDSLIETLGLDPALLSSVEPENPSISIPSVNSSSILYPNGLPTDSSTGLNSAGQPPVSEDFFNTYLHNLNDVDTDPSFDFSIPAIAGDNTSANSPILAAVDTSPHPRSPGKSQADAAAAATSTKGRKRKSEGPPNPNEVSMKLYSPPNPRVKKQKK
ncbi:hypothetical protein E1B28_004273 [Marasmius oreades]|uniref:HSF-type DNA-binding domain-containing protein n=1 Tax=Marasmius oreades TaxID=181124 RepID=A0A9P8ACF3_9AGAR|nr:uncharacterized protein E1B28_004273 [Marasmius oreades]KAG7096866.1 hypothetical protein E1B28_004273 [Marasmius oreades]